MAKVNGGCCRKDWHGIYGHGNTGHNSDGQRNTKHILGYARQILGMCLLVLNVAVEVVTVTMIN